MTSASGCAARRPTPRRANLDLADIFRAYGAAVRQKYALTWTQLRAMHAIETCRTAALGGHVDVCDRCGHQRPAYNSCRNRHCPKCQSLAQARWIAARKARVLPVAHFHVVFTLPGGLRTLARSNPKRIYTLLFRAAADTLLAFGADPKRLGAQVGVTAVLHTWTRELQLHPHVHCIVTAGGLSPESCRWVHPRGRRDYLFPVRAMSKLFRGKFLHALTEARSAGLLQFSGACAALADDGAYARFNKRLFGKRWVVYAKRPFGGADKLFEYLGRYTHRVGLSNQRLVAVNNHGVTFVTRDDSTVTVPPVEFIRRFLQHVLPARFVKIRHYGLMASTNVQTRLPMARAALDAESRGGDQTRPAPPPEPPTLFDWRAHFQQLTGIDLSRCPKCRAGTMISHPVAPIPSPCYPAPPFQAQPTARGPPAPLAPMSLP